MDAIVLKSSLVALSHINVHSLVNPTKIRLSPINVGVLQDYQYLLILWHLILVESVE